MVGMDLSEKDGKTMDKPPDLRAFKMYQYIHIYIQKYVYDIYIYIYNVCMYACVLCESEVISPIICS